MSPLDMPLHTVRLTLRPVAPGDAPLFEQLYAGWRVAQYLLRTPAPFTSAHARPEEPLHGGPPQLGDCHWLRRTA